MKSYRSIEEFERDEIRGSMKMGFSVDEFYTDVQYEKLFYEEAEEDEDGY